MRRKRGEEDLRFLLEVEDFFFADDFLTDGEVEAWATARGAYEAISPHATARMRTETMDQR